MVEQLGGDVVVKRGGDADGGGIEVELMSAQGGDAFGDRRIDRCLPFFAQRGGERGIGIDDGGEFEGDAGLAHFAIDAEMIAPEGSGTDDGDVEWMIVRQSCGAGDGPVDAKRGSAVSTRRRSTAEARPMRARLHVGRTD